MAAKAKRVSFAHLADKFNTQPPPGYKPGAGRGATSLTSSKTAHTQPAPRATPKEKHSDLDLAETKKYEVDHLTITQADAGCPVEPFSTREEREMGHYDEQLNFVWKTNRDSEEEDPWLLQVDELTDSDDVKKKRRRLVEQSSDYMNAREEDSDSIATLSQKLILHLGPKETVSSALKRLGQKLREDADASQVTCGGEAGNVTLKQKFEELTELADRLFAKGLYDVYSDTRESFEGRVGALAQHSQVSTTSIVGPLEGVSQESHELALRSGFEPDPMSGLYFNPVSELWYDPQSLLYWHAQSPGVHYRWDASSGTFQGVRK